MGIGQFRFGNTQGTSLPVRHACTEAKGDRAATATAVASMTAGLAGVPHARNAPLSGIGRWRIGGTADLLIEPRDSGELVRVLRAGADHCCPLVLVGDGTNLLFDDAGLRGAILRLGSGFRGISWRDGACLTAGAACWVPGLVRQAIGRGFGGLEHAIGIPGTLGGLVAMNGGSLRRAVGDHVVAIDVLDAAGNAARLTPTELDFAYRQSRLQAVPRLIATAVELQFDPGDRALLRREAIAILAARRVKFPRNRANCGSVFVSDPALYATLGPPGAAIERAGLKGRRIGGAQISTEHANFIVNLGGASSADVLALIAEAQAAVAAMSGIAMRCEVHHVRPDGTVTRAGESPVPERAF